MDKTLKDGGPAFPQTDYVILDADSGMSARAYMATHILSALVSNESLTQKSYTRESAVAECVVLADALLEALRK